MRLRLTGNGFDKLRDFQRKTEQAPRVLEVISKNLAEQTVELVRQGFEHESDPYGNDWAPLKYRDGRILQDSGRMRDTWHWEDVSARGYTVAPGVDYAVYHQDGTRTIPARPMVPDQDLPDDWKRALSDIATRILSDHFNGFG